MFSLPQINGRIAEKYPENLIFCDSETLLSIAEDSQNSTTCRANCLAELLIRLYLNREETVQIEGRKTSLRNQVVGILSHGEVSAFLYAVMPLKSFNPDNAKRLDLWKVNDADDLSLSCLAALRKRLRTFFRTEGVIPVQCGDNKGWMIPFELEKGESRYAVSDMDGNVIDEWNDAVSQMDIAPYRVRVHCYAAPMKDKSSSFTGRSLMLPVWTAIQKKERILPDYNPFKIILSGAFDQDGILSKVDINGKAAELAEHYPDAILLIPESCDLSGLNVKSANIHVLPNELMEDLIPRIKWEVEQSQELTLDYAFRSLPSLCDDVRYNYHRGEPEFNLSAKRDLDSDWKEIIRILEATAKLDKDDNPMEYLLNLSLQGEAYGHNGNTKKVLELNEKAYAFAKERGVEYRSYARPFVGRKRELEDLYRLLSPYGKEKCKIPILTGPDNIGKHTLACRYREQYRTEYDTVINVSNLKHAKDIYLEMAGDQEFLTCFGIVFNEHDDDEQRVKKIKHALFDKPHGHILILLERIQKPGDLFFDESFSELFPESGEDNVHILATTSSELDWDIDETNRVIPFPVKGLTEEEGMTLLFQWRPFAKGSTAEEAAHEIVRILGGHTGLLADVGKRLKTISPRHDDDYIKLWKRLEVNPYCVQDDVEFDAIRDRIRQAVTGGVDGQNQSFCSICRPISKSFVGRVEELKKLNDLVFKNDGNGGNTLMQIPVITGDAGVGKTELAVAYAYVFADKFPQGRFLIPMQGVTSWADAMTKLVESCDICGQDPIDVLGLPEDFSKLQPDEKRTVVYRMLSRRARKGALLLLLDNLEDMRLISEGDGLRELPGVVPANLHMIATTRINEASSSSLEVPMPFEIDNLKEDAALELFCKICDKVFPFADYPFEDGKLSIDLIPEEKRPGPEKIELIERDYGVLRDIIRLLDQHAWSVEIVAGRIAFKSKKMKIDIQKEWAGLHDNLLGNLTGKTYRSAGNKAESLLQQTFDLILKQDELVEGLGQKIMRLAETASFFPPDQIPEYALRQIWIEQFGDEDITFEQDGMPLTGNAYDYAVTQLKVFRLTGGEEPMFKMHRLTREVLQNRFSMADKLEIVCLMQKCLDDYLKNKKNQTSQSLQPWCTWINEWVTALPVLQEDTAFQKTLLGLAESCLSDETMFQFESFDRREMITETKEMLSHEFLNRIVDQEIKARFLLIKGSRWRHFNEPEKLLRESLAIWRKLASTEPEKYNEYVARTISLLAYLHCTLDQNKEANEEYNEAYTLYQNLEESNPEKYSLSFAAFLNNHALLNLTKHSFVEAEKRFSEALKIFRKQVSNSLGYTCIGTTMANLAVVYNYCRRFKEAEAELKEALSFFRNLMEEDPEEYTSYYAAMLVSLADLHDDMQQFQEAENEYNEALAIFRNLEEKNPEKLSRELADTLHRLACSHSNRRHFVEAEKEYKECIEIYRKLMEEKPEVYSYVFARALNHRARLHSELGKIEDAENDYFEALSILRKLAANNPQIHKETLATFLIDYASFLSEQKSNFNEALSKYNEALSILRELAGAKPTSYNSDLASCLYDTGTIYCRQKNYPVAQSMLSEALAIYRGLATTNPQKYKEQIADSLRHLAEIHCNCGQATSAFSEYTKALSLYRELAVLNPVKYDSIIAMVLSELGNLHLSRKQFKEAERNLSEALVIYRSLDEKKPGSFSLDISLCLIHLSDYYSLTGCYEKAEAELLEALAFCQNFAQDNPGLNQNITTIMNSLADLHNKTIRLSMQKKNGKKRK